VAISKAIRDSNLIVDPIRQQLPNQIPNQSAPYMDAQLDQFTRLKHYTTFALMQLENFFRVLGTNIQNLKFCANSEPLTQSILEVLSILKQCTDGLRNSLQKKESKRILTSQLKKNNI